MPRTLAQNAQYIAETIKPAIKSAIEAQGVTVPSTDSFLDYADRIAEIEGGGSGYQLKDLPTGSIATVTDAAELPLNALKVSVEAWQEGSGDPSPSNIRPIHGWDSGEITVVGKNYAYNNMAADVDFNGVKWEKQADGSIKVSGTATANSYVINAVRADIGDYNGNIIVSGLNGVNNITIDTIPLYDKDNNLITSLAGGVADKVIDLSQYDGVRYISITYKRITNSAVSGIIKPQIEFGTQPTSFEPYQSNQYTQQFPQTIYGAEWDVTDGGMKKKEQGLQISQTGWTHNTTYGYHLFLSNTLLNKALNYNYICECYKTKIGARDQLQDGEIGTYNTQSARNIFAIRDDRFDNVTDFVNAMGNYKIKYELTESSQEIIQLSPLSIRLLEGTNNLYADCGDIIEGEYFVDEGAIDVRKVDYSIGSNSALKISDGRILQGFAQTSGYHSRPLDASGNWLDVDWSKSFEVGVAFKMTAYPSSNNSQYIYGNGTSELGYRFRTPRLYYSDYWQSLLLDISLDGSSWYMDTSVNFKPDLDTWYFMRLKFDLTTLRVTLDITTDFTNYTTLHTEVLSSAFYHNDAALGFGGDQPTGSSSTTNNLLIDTFNTYIKGDEISWGASTGVFPS